MKLYNSKLLIAAFSIATLAACQNNTDSTKEPSGAAGDQLQSLTTGDTLGVARCLINKDSANKMLNSYITSLNGNPNDSNLYSLIINANAMRNYLNDNPDIKNIKFMFAHTLDYINSGHYGQPAGYKSGALTLVIAGYDSSNNYVYIGADMVMDNLVPCPNNCPPSGTAAQNTFTTAPGSSR